MADEIYGKPMVVNKIGKDYNRDYNRGGYELDPCSWMAAQGVAEIRSDVQGASREITNTLHSNALSTGDKFCDLGHKVGEGFCDTLKSIGDSECAILSKVGDAHCDINKNTSDLHHRATIHLAAVERDLQNRIFESQKEALVNRAWLAEKIDKETDFIKKDLLDFRVENIREFGGLKLQSCELENRLARQIENCCCELKEKMDSNEISRLKDKIQSLETRAIISDKCCNGNGNGNNGNGNG